MEMLRLTPELSRAEGVGLDELLAGKPAGGDDENTTTGRPDKCRLFGCEPDRRKL